MNKIRIAKFTLLILTPAIFWACGGGGNNPNSPAGNNGFLIGGTVAGLVNDKKVVLQNNGDDELRVIQNGNFVFNKIVDPGANYSVTVKIQPDGLNCAVDAGSGKAIADINHVKVECTPTSVTGIAQLVGNWDKPDSCRPVWKGVAYAYDFLGINMQENMPTITYGMHVYNTSDCKTDFWFDFYYYKEAATTVRSTFVYKDIPIFRLSLFIDNQERLEVFWISHQQKKICWMVDNLEETDEALGEKIILIPNSPSPCYSRSE